MKGKPTTRQIIGNAKNPSPGRCKVHRIAYWPAFGECPLCLAKRKRDKTTLEAIEKSGWKFRVRFEEAEAGQ